MRTENLSIWTDYSLCCAHHLPHLPETHPCHRLHGHNYEVRLWVTAPFDAHLGWLVDYEEVRALWMERVHSVLDHRLLNDVIGLANPTCEILAVWVAETMNNANSRFRVARVEVIEERGAGCAYDVP